MGDKQKPMFFRNDKFDCNFNRRYLKLRKSKKKINFEIIFKGLKFRVHKEVLIERCDYFSIMLKSKLQEGNSTSVTLHYDCDVNTLSTLINYLYSGSIKVTRVNMFAICSAANYFLLEDLEKFCDRYICMAINHNTIGNIHVGAKQHYRTKLVDYTANYLEMHFEDFVEHKSTLKWSFELVRDLISSDYVQVSSEIKVLRLVCNWLSWKYRERKGYADDLLEEIRFNFMTPEDLDTLDDGVYLKTLQLCKIHMEKQLKITSLTGIAKQPVRLYFKGVHLYGESKSFESPDQRLNEHAFIERWLPNGDSTNILHPASTHRRRPAMACLGNSVYLIGGMDKFTKQHLNTVEVLNPLENTWSEVAPMNQERWYHTCCCYGEKIYVFGGFKGSEKLLVSEVYCPEENRWEILPNNRSFGGIMKAVVVEDSIFLICDTSIGEEKIISMYQYKPRSGEWFDVPNHDPCLKRTSFPWHVFAVSHHTKIFLFKTKRRLVVYDTVTQSFYEDYFVPKSETFAIGRYSRVLLFKEMIYITLEKSSSDSSTKVAVLNPRMLNTPKIVKSHIRCMFQYTKDFTSSIEDLDQCCT